MRAYTHCKLHSLLLSSLLALTVLVIEVLAAVASGANAATCGSCSMPTMDKGSEEKLLIEIAKQQILSKLHLKERPNITQTVPRAALLTALRKLHAGRVRQDGTFELENNLQSARAKEQGYEVVSFADTDDPDSNSAHPSLTFQFAQERDKKVQVLQATLWLYVPAPEAASRDSRAAAQIYLSGPRSDNRTLLLQKSLEVQRGGWHTFPLTQALQAFLDGAQRRLRLEALCASGGRDLCAHDGPLDPSHRPFLVAQVRPREEDASDRARGKRSLRCGENVSVCCKKDFYIKFRDIEWHEWIIAPEGYHMNYCMGKCPPHLAGSPGIASSFHATVLSQLKANGIHTVVSSCCAPIQRRPLSMMYFNTQHSIVKADVPDMIVESCGCT
ncbi:inhibin beta B chain [Conger conger]|uniref:inhibin beta B chain n=1 Tax=Conger conger TaxID=82655 RepID=UPI002A5A43C3|nr:inhibin beta B chain [Conger conger]